MKALAYLVGFFLCILISVATVNAQSTNTATTTQSTTTSMPAKPVTPPTQESKPPSQTTSSVPSEKAPTNGYDVFVALINQGIPVIIGPIVVAVIAWYNIKKEKGSNLVTISVIAALIITIILALILVRMPVSADVSKLHSEIEAGLSAEKAHFKTLSDLIRDSHADTTKRQAGEAVQVDRTGQLLLAVNALSTRVDTLTEDTLRRESNDQKNQWPTWFYIVITISLLSCPILILMHLLVQYRKVGVIRSQAKCEPG